MALQKLMRLAGVPPGWWAMLAAAFAAGCGGGGGDGGGPQAPNEARLEVARTGDLVAYFKAKITQRAALGLSGTAVTVPTVGARSSAGSVLANTGAPLVGPLVREDDLIQAEGNMLYGLHRAYATDTGRQPPAFSAMARAADGSLQSAGRVVLDTKFIPRGLYVAGGGTRAAVLSQQDPYADRQPIVAADAGITVLPEYSRTFSLDLFAVGGGPAPAQIKQMRIDGLLLGSRLIGNTLYLVSTWSPDLTRFSVPPGASPAVVDAALKDLDTAAVIPTVRLDGGQPQPLVAEADCLVQKANASLALQLTSVTAIDLGSPSLARTSRCFAGGSEAVHIGASSVYLASSRQYTYGSDVVHTVFPANSRTDIHKFTLRGGQVDYGASGSVDGHLGWDLGRMPARMNEYQGDLRVVTFTGAVGQSGTPPVTVQGTQASPAVFSVLRENAAEGRLAEWGRLALALRTPRGDQQVDTAHYAGPRVYVATYAATEPVWVLDLSNTARPMLSGEVAAGGYADRLYPLPEGLLLGIGRDRSQGGTADGIPLALFDVRNAAQTRQLASEQLGTSGSLTTLGGDRPVLNVQIQDGRVRLAFPARVYQAPVVVGTAPPLVGYQGAARLEVNTSAGTLTIRSMLPSTPILRGGEPELYNRFDIANERSLQADRAVYHLSGGQTFYQVGD